MQINFIESSPIPVKAAMAMMGLLEEVYRLPLVPPRPGSRERIAQVLRDARVADSRPPRTRLNGDRARADNAGFLVITA